MDNNKNESFIFYQSRKLLLWPANRNKPQKTSGTSWMFKVRCQNPQITEENVSSVPLLNHRRITHSTTLEIKSRHCRWFQEYVAGRFIDPEGVVFSNELLFILNENLNGQKITYTGIPKSPCISGSSSSPLSSWSLVCSECSQITRTAFFLRNNK